MIRAGRVVSEFMGNGELRIGLNIQRVELTPDLNEEQRMALARVALLKEKAQSPDLLDIK